MLVFKVFLESPCELYTADIQSAFMHLSTGRKENEIAYLNRAHSSNHLLNTLNGGGSSEAYYAKPDGQGSNPANRGGKSLLEPFMIKNITLKLIIPKFVRS